MNGLEIIQLARRMDPGIQCIMITGQGNEKLAVEVLKSGVTDYLSKPFAHKDVIAAVKNAFENRRSGAGSPHRDLASASRELCPVSVLSPNTLLCGSFPAM